MGENITEKGRSPDNRRKLGIAFFIGRGDEMERRRVHHFFLFALSEIYCQPLTGIFYALSYFWRGKFCIVRRFLWIQRQDNLQISRSYTRMNQV